MRIPSGRYVWRPPVFLLRMLRRRKFHLLGALLVAGALAVPALGQAPLDPEAPGVDKDADVVVYRNSVTSRGQYVALRKHGGGECRRRHLSRALRVAVGRGNDRCMYRPPVGGGNVDLAATATMLRETPPSLRPRTGVGIVLRSGGGGEYRFEVLPNRLTWRLTKLSPGADGSEGQRAVLAEARDREAINGTGERNRIRLRAFGRRLAGWIGNKLVVRFTDSDTPLGGRTAAVALFGEGAVQGAAALFDSFTVRARDPRGPR